MTENKGSTLCLNLHSTDPWHVRFHDLMPYRVREILLVSSNYDAFILSEDGRLSEQLFVEYSDLNLSSAPRITHVSNSQKALQLLQKRRFDLVITMVRLEDTNVNAFGKMVKSIKPNMPVVLLVFNETDLDNFPGGIDRKVIDHSFLWRGDTRILLTVIKVIEDKINVDHDVTSAGVRTIIVVEDSVSRYSAFLTMLYSVLMSQSQSLISEGLNDLHKTYRMRARPKLLLATTYEEAIAYYQHYRNNVLAVISDVNFPKANIKDADAGFQLLNHIREDNPNITILLQSAKSVNIERAKKEGFLSIDKNSPNLLRKIRKILLDNLGFGSFVFRLPDGKELARANDLYDMERILKTVNPVSIEYHASRDHFSTWFYARSLFVLADTLKQSSVKDFDGIEDLRQFFLKMIKRARQQEQEGQITDFSKNRVGPENLFVRMGRGSVGGKGRGLAFLNSLFSRLGIEDKYMGLKVRIPKSVCIGTDEYEIYMERNKIHDELGSFQSDTDIIKHFIEGRLSDEHWEHLRFVLNNMSGPLAVRSSSLLEDSQFQPFAGIYSTYMIPNNHPDPQERFSQLCSAIKAVYASLFCKNARSYIAGTPHSSEDESMAVVIQQVVGQYYENRFYPLVSGVAQSYNYYPIGHQRAEEGIAQIALGLGHSVVAGGSVVRFSPKTPQILPQLSKPSDYLKLTQKDFLALDLSKNGVDFFSPPEQALIKLGLDVSEKDGSFMHVGSVYSAEDDTIRDNFNLAGPRVVTFNNILKWNDIPLAEVLADVMEIIRSEVGFSVELEFALDKKPGEDPVLYILQMRPLAIQIMHGTVETEGYDPEQILCRTDMSLGHGTIKNIRDIVYVKAEHLDRQTTKKITEHIERMNSLLLQEKAPYFLIGPGRWGSTDPNLGIPVDWAQISGTKLIAETAFEDIHVEPSQGTHFFQNIIAKGIGYLTLSQPATDKGISDAYLDTQWLDKQPVKTETEWVRHIRLKQPIIVNLDGRVGKATVVKP